ncbi:MAG: DUF2510 domain-containing protein [Acidimicrobiaceae bacterium]|nr:DUF2510 domain-containing protein [Acidimicrobiaceae bacterium]
MSDLPPADWYTDPEDDSQYRYWDGSAWTEHRAPRHDSVEVGPELDPGQMRRPGRLIADTLSIAVRRWRSCAAAALIYLAGQVVMVVLLLVAANEILMGELGEIWDRINDPDFDPEAPEQTAYFESLEFDLSPVNLALILLGIGAVWISGNVMQATVARVTLSELRDRPLAPSDALRQALRRVPRLVGLDLQVFAILLIALLVVVFAGYAAPVLLIPLLPLFIVGAVYGMVIVSLAYVVASVGPEAWTLGYGTRLVRRRFWRTLGRMLLVFAALMAVTFAVGLAFILAGSSSLAFEVVSQLVHTVVGTVIGVVGLVAIAIIYHDLGGESD